MTKVVVVGAAGRMGRTLVRCIATRAVPEVELVGAVDLWDSPEIGRDAGLVAGAGELGVALTANLAAVAPAADVVIDFSAHHGTAGNASRCAEWRRALVIGTTGLNAEERREVELAARRIPVVMSPNMSVGVNLLLALVERAARALRGRGYDVEIIERHHRQKRDAPSGTALALGEAVARGFEWPWDEVAVHGRHGMSPHARPERQIGFHAVRGGDLVGDHTVLLAGAGECIELSHRATSRETFAVGALQAARWIVGRPPGLYSMRDVLELDTPTETSP
ncbi:MAG: 4-hydroxy-tetrahydrodipicolinate reductase [Kiritimatiellae bacterium]|nr:4-hydroxy-tetrahydrodipicolinate reductase [Kiritimatiellia bacterium]